MNSKIIVLAVAVLSVAVIGMTGPTVVFAKKPADPNCFGDSASDLAQSDPNMGDHSREGSVSGSHPFDSDGPDGDDDKPGRQGIGNVGDDEDTNIHPSDLAKALGGDCDE